MTVEDCLSTLDGKTTLNADDALAMRRAIYGTGAPVTPAEADAVFRLNAEASDVSAEWRDLFVEVMIDVVVNQQDPPRYVDDAKAEWLIASVSRYRRIRDDELELLIHVLESAESTPAKLSGFVLDMVKASILFDLRQRGRLERDGVERIRRFVFAVGGDGNVGVTRREAEALFDINDALAGKSADPAWTDLFVRAVGKSVLFQSLWVPDAAQEIHREAWLDDARPHPLRSLERMADLGADGRAWGEGFRELIHWDFLDHDFAKFNATEQAIEREAEQVTAEEAHWLEERMGRDGRLDGNEQALMAFLRANATALDPSLIEFVAQPLPASA